MPALNDDAEIEIAGQLWQAYISNTVIAPPHLTFGGARLESGYRVQRHWVDCARSAGRQKAGYKIAMTSKAIQDQFGIDRPTSGVIFNHMVLSDNAEIQIPGNFQGRLEGEVAFLMRHDLNSMPISAEDTRAAISEILPAIEIANSRISNWNVSSFDFVADNAAAALVIIGDSPLLLDASGLATVRMQMTVDSKIRSEGKGSDCLGSPVMALRWLALDLLASGKSLQKGDLVMSGSLGPAVPVEAGTRIQMLLGHAPPVKVAFAGDRASR